MSSDLAIVIVSYGSADLLSVNLVRLHSAVPAAKVVVVDNWTTADERETVTALGQRNGWAVVTPENNMGFGAGVNLGVRRGRDLGAQRFLVVNPDAWLDRPAIEALARRVDENPLRLAAPIIVRPDGRPWSVGHEMVLADGSMRRCPGLASGPGARPWVSGAVLLFTAELWDVVGGFDERYFLYWEDVDLSHRVVDAGGELVVVPEAIAYHDEGGTQEAGGERAKSATYYYYNIRNRLLYASLHLSAAGQRRWSRGAIPAAWQVLLRGGRRQFLRPVPAVSAAARGLRDGWRLTVTGRSRPSEKFGAQSS